MYPEALTVAVRHKLSFIVMVMKDGFYSSVRQAAVARGLSQQAVQLYQCRWAEVFQAMGCASERVESLPALASALNSWLMASGPLVLELAFDPEAYLTMTEGLR
jgi:thiamine pyrophosphate-dependent acetolactate synthase large subunit-like protein